MEFPYLCLLVSGGHSMLLIVHGVGDYTLLGTSLDDSVGGLPFAAACTAGLHVLTLGMLWGSNNLEQHYRGECTHSA